MHLMCEKNSGTMGSGFITFLSTSRVLYFFTDFVSMCLMTLLQ